MTKRLPANASPGSGGGPRLVRACPHERRAERPARMADVSGSHDAPPRRPAGGAAVTTDVAGLSTSGIDVARTSGAAPIGRKR
ncbi:hypothetical protein [Streptomyces sp. NPDC008141]|uniref:hypothetical protein n=1 Tax=Streptomyces sp. NPDC008141 TaxID=3364815 RepID=UPI0036EA5A0D